MRSSGGPFDGCSIPCPLGLLNDPWVRSLLHQRYHNSRGTKYYSMFTIYSCDEYITTAERIRMGRNLADPIITNNDKNDSAGQY
jgi:hypothetical protein